MTRLPVRWAQAMIGEVCETSLGKMLDAKQQTGLHPTPYLRNINVRWGSFNLADIAQMDVAPDELDRVLARCGDVIACGEENRAAQPSGAPPNRSRSRRHSTESARSRVCCRITSRSSFNMPLRPDP